MTYLDEVEARANAATPGPWKYENHYVPGVLDVRSGSKNIARVLGPEETQNKPDVIFIANARTDIPELLARLRLAATVLEGGCSCQEERFLTKRDDLLCETCEALKAILR